MNEQKKSQHEFHIVHMQPTFFDFHVLNSCMAKPYYIDHQSQMG